MSKKIPLTKGLSTTVDEGDFENVGKHKWFASYTLCGRVYVRRRFKKGILISMHRVIMSAKKGQLVDHINGDTLDNRRQNLRIVTHSQNSLNTKAHKDSISKHKGVSFYKDRWLAAIMIRGKIIRLGSFDKEKDAAESYKRASLQHHGEYSVFYRSGA